MKTLVRALIKRIPFSQDLILRWRYSRYLKKIARQSSVGSGPKILIINHHYDQDIEAIINGCKSFCEFFVIDAMPTYNRASLFFKTTDERDGMIPYSKIDQRNIQGYRKVSRKIYEDIYSAFAFDGVLMPSDSFWWIREFLEIAKEKGTPRIVLDKEGMISPYYYEVHSQQIRERYPFMSDHLLVWSDRQKKFWMKSGVAQRDIEVLGQPRSDFFFNEDRWLSKKDLGLEEKRKTILFFTFDIDAYIHIFPAEEIQSRSLSWLPLRNDINDVLIKFAKSHDNVDVVIKVHPQQSDIGHIRKIFSETGLTNVKMMEGANLSNHLIVNSDLIIGFQTTAIVEALLTEKPVIYAAWSDTEKKLRDDLIPLHDCKGLVKADSKEKFVKLLDLWLAGEKMGGDLAYRKEFTDYYLRADGKVGERLSKTLVDIVRKVN
jgi:surface carbohydrate biosynthesis protein